MHEIIIEEQNMKGKIITDIQATLHEVESKNAWNFIRIIFDKANVYLSRWAGRCVIFDNSLFQACRDEQEIFWRSQRRSIYAVWIGFKSILRKTIACKDPSRFADMGNVCTRIRIDLPTSVNVTVFRTKIDYYWNMNMSTNGYTILFGVIFCVVHIFWRYRMCVVLVRWSTLVSVNSHDIANITQLALVWRAHFNILFQNKIWFVSKSELRRFYNSFIT